MLGWKMIEIDGSIGEGGGQVLRTSLALAAVLRREVRVFNIRAGREEPGLKAQHLTGAKALTQICGASSKGLQIGSTECIFSPGPIRASFLRFDVGTAGSITLVLQTLMPLLPQIQIDASENDSHLGPGSGIVLCATRDNRSVLGGDSLGERGRRAEVVGEDAARKLLEEISSGAFLDRHMGDMIVPYLALAAGVSDVSLSQITMHTFTNVKVAERVAGVRFDPLPEVGLPGRLRVKGLGLRREEVSVSPRE